MATKYNDPLDDIKKYNSVAEFGKDYPELEAITVTATRTKPKEESQSIEEITVSAKQTRREKRRSKKSQAIEEVKVTGGRELKKRRKKAARRKKRATIKYLNRQARVDRLEAKMETAEQKRDPYRHGGVAKPN